jgi:hypothetical protein
MVGSMINGDLYKYIDAQVATMSHIPAGDVLIPGSASSALSILATH